MNSFGKIVEIILLAIMLFIVPVQYNALKQDNIVQTMLMTQTSLFTDTIRNKGYIDRELYEEFLGRISKTDNVYDVEITHYKKIYNYDEDTRIYVMNYECCTNEVIAEEIYSDEGKYRMEAGDFICVSVKSKGKTFGEKIQGILTDSDINSAIDVVYGGVIRDEAY